MGAPGGGGKALGQLGNIVVVAHPADALPHVLEQGGIAFELGHGLAELRHLAGGHRAAQQVGHHLGAVADAQHGDAQFKDLFGAQGGVLGVDAVGAAGEEDALAVPQLLRVGFVAFNLAVDPQVTDPAGDELGVLAAKVQHHYPLVGVVCHVSSHPFSQSYCRAIVAYSLSFRKPRAAVHGWRERGMRVKYSSPLSWSTRAPLRNWTLREAGLSLRTER